jgi:hypothetical protein
MSLAVPFANPQGGGTLVRLSVGLEAIEDLVDDLAQAIDSSFRVNTDPSDIE